LTLTLTGPDADCFRLSGPAADGGSLEGAGFGEAGIGETGLAFSVAPKPGLGAGVYSAAVRASGGNGSYGASASFGVTFRVR
jgi:hypothetical protein